MGWVGCMRRLSGRQLIEPGWRRDRAANWTRGNLEQPMVHEKKAPLWGSIVQFALNSQQQKCKQKVKYTGSH